MNRRLVQPARALLVVSLLASCAPPASRGTGGGRTDDAPGTGVTVFGDARVGVFYGPDRPGGESRARPMAE